MHGLGSVRDLGRVHTENLGNLFLALSHLCFSPYTQVAVIALGSTPWFLRPKNIYLWRLAACYDCGLPLGQTAKNRKFTSYRSLLCKQDIPFMFEFLKHLSHINHPLDYCTKGRIFMKFYPYIFVPHTMVKGH